MARARVLSRHVEAILYRHADDGLPYRHDFERGGSVASLQPDGSLTIRNKRAKLWGMYDVHGRRQPFLENPRGRRERMATKKRKGAKRSPPKGFKTWAAYMASIRPGAKRRKSRRSSALTRSEGKSMATRKKKRRRNPATNPPRRGRHVARPVHHRRRRNPPAARSHALTPKALIADVMDGGIGAVCVLTGKVGSRQLRRQFGYAPGTVIGSMIELGSGLALGLIGSRVLPRAARPYARDVMVGAFVGTLETVLKPMAIPFVSDSLGDAGVYDTETIMLPADATTAIANTPMGRLGAYSGRKSGLGAYSTQPAAPYAPPAFLS